MSGQVSLPVVAAAAVAVNIAARTAVVAAEVLVAVASAERSRVACLIRSASSIAQPYVKDGVESTKQQCNTSEFF